MGDGREKVSWVGSGNCLTHAQPYAGQRNCIPTSAGGRTSAPATPSSPDMRAASSRPGIPDRIRQTPFVPTRLRRSKTSVCRVELLLRRFDVRGNDVNDCIDYLELPDRRKVCGMRREAISMEFSAFSDYMVLMFRSESGSTAAGFDIDVRQVDDSCQTSSTRTRKCDQTFRGYISKLMSPNFPWSYQPSTFCMYMIEPADKRMCYFSLEFNKFELDGVGEFVDGLCNKDYFQLPDGHRLCSNSTGRSKCGPVIDRVLKIFS